MLDALKKSAGWLLVMGIILLVLGTAAICFPMATAIGIDLVIGWILVIAGIAQVIHMFQSHKWGGFLLSLLLAVLYLAVGIVMLVNPMRGVLTLTLLLAIFFVVGGIFKIIASLQLRSAPNWGWMLFSGIVALILGGIIWTQWPSSSAWVLGLLFGIDLIFGGWAMIMLSVAVRRLP